ncbi:neutral zinc metallopeptidase [Nonomuraea sp. LPB2021202275-12-8]|uniref:neutral zinc metallopeptidase n=1 Tax=Nonomuraea sp. LPB2021202275-12-8 TaxID=3120159 RepID=UPI00300D6063
MGVAGILGTVFGSIAALFVLIVIGVAMIGGAKESRTTTPIAIPTLSPYDEPSDRPSTDSSREPTQRPTPTRTEEPDEEPDVDPPARATLNTTLKNNTVYRAGALPRLSCRAGNASIFSHSQLKSLILRTGRCMDRAWGQILQKQGIPFSPPNYAIAAGRGRGACGDYPAAGSMVPYYCPRNNTIYASTSAMARGNGNARGYGQIISWHGGIISMMAHEYGHHVQNITGLMNSWWAQTLDSTGSSGKLALSRRLELQATCFGGMWMRSVAGTYPISTGNRGRLFWFYGQVGDYPGFPRDHGSRVNNNRWFRQGWLRGEAYQCNTWMAASSTTS